MVGGVSVAAQILIATLRGGLTTTNHLAQIVALMLLSTLVVFYCIVRERRLRELNRVRSVSEAAQDVLLRPPPRRIGPLRVAWLYLAAGDETRIGGDLFAVARTDEPATRVIIGDVRGKGLAAIGEASVVLGAFREGAHRYATLPELAAVLEESVCRNLEEVADTDHDIGEHFVTALILAIPNHGQEIEMINCGHPPPLLLHDHRITVLQARRPGAPLGMCGLPAAGMRTDTFPFEAGDMLLLYTDGVIEARSPDGAFYPLTERIAALSASSPDTLLERIRRDLLTHVGGRLDDDVALLAIERTAVHPLARHHAPARHADLHRTGASSGAGRLADG
jgi:serine phosphatase RsbU (regulator of sigma subunit)